MYLSCSVYSNTDPNSTLQRSVDITPEMALQVMKYLRREGVDFIVAPYEADAQLAALATAGKENGGIAAVITEDSDLLAYGCSTVRMQERRSLCERIAAKTCAACRDCFQPHLLHHFCVNFLGQKSEATIASLSEMRRKEREFSI